MTVIADVQINHLHNGLVMVPRRGIETRTVKTAAGVHLKPNNLKRAEGGIFTPFVPEGLASLLKDERFQWSQEAARFLTGRNQVEVSYGSIIEILKRLRLEGVSYAATLTQDLQCRDKLDAHQIVNVAAMALEQGFGLCVFDEQGAGKTVTFIFAFDLLCDRDLADSAVIVAPLSMVAEWPRDIERFTGTLYKTRLLTGSEREKRSTLAAGADIIITNFETAIAMEAELRTFLMRQSGRSVLAVDESFFIKNPDAKRTRALFRLREWCDRAYVLCGTPAPNSAHDLVAQINFVDLGKTFRSVTIPEDRQQATRVIQGVLNGGAPYIRNLKKDVLPDLPSKTFNECVLPFQPIQKEIYQSLLESLKAELENSDELSFRKNVSSFLAKRSALLQVCSNPDAVVKGYTEIPAKLIAIDNLLSDLIQRCDKKVIIWSFYTNSINNIMDRYKSYRPVRYDGMITSIAERRSAVKRFQEDDETKLFVANPAAAGAGLTLHRAHHAIYESFSNQAAHYLQSLDRIHRRGQTSNVEYTILLIENSVESIEFGRLRQKEKTAQDLLGDKASSAITRTLMLSELRELIALAK
jgi:SNF2 family DNA or RNA helicase